VVAERAFNLLFYVCVSHGFYGAELSHPRNLLNKHNLANVWQASNADSEQSSIIYNAWVGDNGQLIIKNIVPAAGVGYAR
jgi:hypothetical protein